MNNPLVSVIVATYNQQSTISACLDSILSQNTDFDFEIIIGDDCSDDLTSSIIKDYSDIHPQITVIRPRKNVLSTGRSLTFSYLIPLARGMYIAFCEGDDYWTYNKKLQQQIDFLNKNRQYSACFHDYTIEINNQFSYPKHGKHREDAHLSDMINLSKCQLATIVMRTECFTNSHVAEYFNHPTHCYGDINYYAACFETGKIKYLPYRWSVYRKSPGSLTATDQANNTATSKHIDGLNALIDIYGNKYRFLMTDFESRLLLERSSISTCQTLFHAIILKIRAFIKSPFFIWRIYAIKWGLK